MSIYHKPGERPFILPCSIFGGRSPKTGKKVGQRHRWDGMFGRCAFCGHSKDEVMSRPERCESTLDEVLARCNNADGVKGGGNGN